MWAQSLTQVCMLLVTFGAHSVGLLSLSETPAVETPKQQGARKRVSEAVSVDVLQTPSSKVVCTEEQTGRRSASAAEEGEFVPGKKKNKRRRSSQKAAEGK